MPSGSSVLDGMRAYLQIASGLSEVTRQRAAEVVRGLAAQGEAGLGMVVPEGVREQASAVTEELLAAGRDNRNLLLGLVRSEVERQVARLGLVSSDDLAAAQARAERLEIRVRDLELQLAEHNAPPPVVTDAASAGRPMTSAATKEAATEGAATRKTAAKKTTTKRAAARKAASTTKAPAATRAAGRKAPPAGGAPAERVEPTSPEKAAASRRVADHGGRTSAEDVRRSPRGKAAAEAVGAAGAAPGRAESGEPGSGGARTSGARKRASATTGSDKAPEQPSASTAKRTAARATKAAAADPEKRA